MIQGLRVRLFNFNEYSLNKAILIIHGGPGVEIPIHKIKEYLCHIPKNVLLVCPIQRALYRPKPWGTFTDVNDIETIRKALQLSKWQIVMGRSWGASISLLYAHMHSNRVNSVISISPSSLKVTQSEQKYNRLIHTRLNSNNDDFLSVLESYEDMYPPGNEHSLKVRFKRAQVQSNYRANNFYLAENFFTKILCNLKTQSVKIHVFYGENDKLLTKKDMDMLNELSNTIILKNHGHDSHPFIERKVFESLRDI